MNRKNFIQRIIFIIVGGLVLSLLLYYWSNHIQEILTGISLLIMAFTLLEVSRQRKTSYMPDISIGEAQFYIYCKKIQNIYLPFVWTNKKINSDGCIQIPLCIDVFNLGLGAAKHLRIEWSFDTTKLIKEIRKIDTDKKFEIECKKSFIAIRVPKENYNYCTSKFTDIEDYILPAHIIKKPLKITLHEGYLRLLSILLYLSLRGEEAAPDFPGCSPLKLKLFYKDVGGDSYKKEFEFHFCFQFYTATLAERLDSSVEVAAGIICMNFARHVGISGVETATKN